MSIFTPINFPSVKRIAKIKSTHFSPKTKIWTFYLMGITSHSSLLLWFWRTKKSVMSSLLHHLPWTSGWSRPSSRPSFSQKNAHFFIRNAITSCNSQMTTGKVLEDIIRCTTWLFNSITRELTVLHALRSRKERVLHGMLFCWHWVGCAAEGHCICLISPIP